MQATISTAKLYSQAQKINEVFVGKENLDNTQIFIYLTDSHLQPLVKVNQFMSYLLQVWDKDRASELIYNTLSRVTNEYPTITACVMAAIDDKIVCATTPKMGLSILRSDKYGVLLPSDSDKFQVTTGKIQAGDTLFFGTSDAFLLGEQIKSLMRQKFPDDYSSHSFLALGGGAVVYRCTGFSEDTEKNRNMITQDNGFPNESYESHLSVGHLSESKPKQSNIFLKIKNFKQKLISPVSNTSAPPFPVSGQILSNTKPLQQTISKPLVPLAIGIVCLALLIVSIVFGVGKKEEKEKQAVFDAELMQTQKELKEAIVLAEVAPDRAREIFSNVQSKVLGLATENQNDQRVISLVKTLEDNKKELLKEYPTNVSQFSDLTLLSANFSGSKIILSDNVIYVWDKNGAKLSKTVVSSKRSEILAGPTILNDAIGVNVYTDRVFFFYEKGVKELGESSFLYEQEFGKDQLFYAYASNFYIVRKDGVVLRIAPDASGVYGAPQEWLAEGSEVDFSTAVQIMVDGAIWVLSENGQITKMSNGIVQPFRISGVSPKITALTSIYTSQESKFIYILDGTDGRVVVLSKDGKFVAQYLSDTLKNAIDFVVAESEGKAFVLMGETVLTFDLGHLD